MFPVTIKFVKTHDLAVLPKFNHADPYVGDSGLDLTSVDTVTIPARKYGVVPVGLKLGYITPGDKIAQLIVYPLIQADIEWTDQAVESARGEKGFGSSDKK